MKEFNDALKDFVIYPRSHVIEAKKHTDPKAPQNLAMPILSIPDLLRTKMYPEMEDEDQQILQQNMIDNKIEVLNTIAQQTFSSSQPEKHTSTIIVSRK